MSNDLSSAMQDDLGFTTVAAAIETYVATRDDLAEKRKAFNEYEANAKHYMNRIQVFIQMKANELGVDSFKTAAGTAYRSVKTQYRTEDWEAFLNWLKETGNFQCIERRPAKLAVKEIHDESGVLPPGLSHHVEVEFDVRRPSK